MSGEPPTHSRRPMLSRRPPMPLTGRVAAPGDKSISHRALMFGALAVGETRITGLLTGEDVLRTAAAMRALGATVTHDHAAGDHKPGDQTFHDQATGDHATHDQPPPPHHQAPRDQSPQDRPTGIWRVSGRGVGGLTEPADVLDMGNSGTAARLLCGILASHPIFSVLTGDASLRGRPMRRVTDPLTACGARFTSRAGGLLPLAIDGAREALALEYRVPVPSAQVKSAILLAGLNARGTTRVEEPEATRDHTENMLRHFGAAVSVEPAGAGRVITLHGQPELRAADVVVPGDPSSVAFPLVAALLVPGSSVTIPGVGLNPLRAGLFLTLEEMGAGVTVTNRRIEGGEPVGDLTVTGGALRGVDVPPERAPTMIDEYPVLAVAAAGAAGITRMRGLRELRVKESDRFAATASLLSENGVRVEIEGDDLIVHGTGAAPAGGGLVRTHMDHRIAMAALVLGLVTERPVRIDDGGFIDTSFPSFAAVMRRIGAPIEDA